MPSSLMNAPINQPCVIRSIHTRDERLLQRFISFGLNVGSLITPLYHSSCRATLAIQVQGSQVALRESEAKIIEVEPLTHAPS